MALNSGKILMRRGQEVNFDPSKMTPGEWAVSLDSKYVRMCFSPGVCVRMATYDAFEADMEQMKNILQECKSIEEFVERVSNEIKNIVIDVERIELASANALKSEQNALNSANTASKSAEIATNKANEAIENANTASVKAEQAINSAEITVRKAGEAEVSADNSQNMSIQSQSYAVGGTGTREGEDTDNSKYYNEQSKSNAKRAEDAAERAVAISDVDIATVELAGLVKPDGDSIKILPDGTIYSNTAEIESKLEETTEKVNIIIQKAELNIKDSASGDKIHLTDSADGKIVDFALFGKAIQKGEPTPEAPIDIEVSGESYNLIPYPYSETTHTQNGITWTDNRDGTVTANGTQSDGFSDFFLISTDKPMILKAGTYIFNGCLSGGVLDETYFMLIGSIIDGVTARLASDTGNGATFTIDKDTPIWALIRYAGGVVATNHVFKPKLRKASLSVEVKSENEDGTKSITATILTPSGIAGIKVSSDGNYTDENGQQWICDEIVKYADGTGKRIKRINKVIADGVNLAFSERYPTDNNVIYSIDTNAIPAIKREHSDESVPLMSSHFITTNYGNIVNNDIMGITKVGGYTRLICGFGKNSELLNLELANSWLRSNNVAIYYQLETPVETPLTSEEIAEIEKLHTLYPVTNISNDADCGMKVKYIADSKNYIDNKLALQAKAREEEMMAMLLLLPEETQAKMIENDTNNLLTESEE